MCQLTIYAQLTVLHDYIQSCLTVSLSLDLSVGDIVDVVAGEYSRESGTIVHQNDMHLTIRSIKTHNLVVCHALFTTILECSNIQF